MTKMLARMFNKLHWWFYNQFFDVVGMPKTIVKPDGMRVKWEDDR